MEQNTVLTLENIRNDEELQAYGLKPGDELTPDGTIVRKFSEIQERQDLGMELTQDDIDVNPWMQEQGVEPGDRYVNGEIKKDLSGSSWEQFKYHYEKSGGMTGYLKDIGTIYTGIDFYMDTSGKTTEQKYGEGFEDATPEVRREMLFRAQERQLQDEFGSDFKPDPGSFAGMAGAFAGEVVDPTSLIPFLGGVKGAFATGAALGGAYSASQDIAERGTVDPGKMAVTAGVSAFIPGGITFGAKKLGQRAARKTVDRVQEAVNRELASPWGTVDVDNIPRIAAAAGVSSRQLGKSLEQFNMTPENIVDLAVPQFSPTKAVAKDSYFSRLLSPGMDKYMGVLSTQLKNISPFLSSKLRRHEFDLGVANNRAMNIIRPFQEQLKAMGNSPLKTALARELGNAETNGFARAESIMNQVDPSMVKNFEQVKKLLDDIKKTYIRQYGPEVFGELDNYFPRLVDDLDTLKKALNPKNPKHFAPFDDAKQAYATEKGISVDEIPLNKQEEIINKVLVGRAASMEKPGPRVAQRRRLTLTDDLLQYYATPEKALENYVRRGINTTRTNDFIGKKNFSLSDDLEELDLSKSIGSYINREMNFKNLDGKQQQAIEDLLKARFIDGETPMGKLTSSIKEAGYIYTIANPTSALVQLGDIAITAALKGTFNTFTSMVLPKRIKMSDVMEAQISKEFNDPSLFAKLLEKSFTVSGFRAVDRLGKETVLNSSFKFNSKLARKSPEKFKKKWGDTFPDNINQVMDDFKNKRVTDDTLFVLFNELSDQQPISFAELPPGALDPKLRLLYMLKSFTLKQMDVVRREVVQEYKKGNKTQAAMTAFRLGTYLSLAGLGINQVRMILRGEELLEPEELPTEALWSLLGVYGLSKFTTDKYLKRGEIGQAAANTLFPPLTLADNIAKGVIDATNEDSETLKGLKTIPVYGDLLYMWFGGGAEKAIERREGDRD
jgi:hypothetical protein